MINEKDIDLLVVFHPAECWARCEDRDCIYTHRDSWSFDGEHYSTESEAIEAAKAAYEIMQRGK